jgi:hypothetical protein
MRAGLTILLLSVLQEGCAPRDTSTPAASSAIDPRQAAAAAPVTRHPIRFIDATAAAGIDWRYTNGATGRHLFIETTGGGVALFDANNDGWLDLFALQGGPVPGATGAERRFPTRNALYLGKGDGLFADATEGSGLEVPTGYGQGVAAADYDNDGRTDLYVTAYGGNRLFHNEGGGRFRDVTREAGVADIDRSVDRASGSVRPRPGRQRGSMSIGRGDVDRSTPGSPPAPGRADRSAPAPPRPGAAELAWPLSAAWGDYDNDGRLDLFVCHYVRWSLALDRKCPRSDGKLAYCRPQVYEQSRSRLYHNEGGGRFTDVTRRARIDRVSGKSMGAAWLDADEDGDLDLFVSNDTTPNFLLRNNGDGTFTDRALLAGVAVGPAGQPLSGMGIGLSDYDRDGRQDLFVVNFAGQPKTLYRNLGHGRFADRSYASNLASSDLNFLGFGLECLDYDLDGFPDLVVGNGHVLDNPEVLSHGATYAQSQQLFHNRGDSTFAEDRRSLGDLVFPRVTRGLAVGDWDNDGDPDLALGAQSGPLQLFRNDGGNRHHWITFRLEGTRANRDAIGAKLVIGTANGRQTAWVHGGSSYCATSDRRVTFGLGDATEVRSLSIRWPGGHTQRFGRLAADRFYRVREGAAAAPATSSAMATPPGAGWSRPLTPIASSGASAPTRAAACRSIAPTAISSCSRALPSRLSIFARIHGSPASSARFRERARRPVTPPRSLTFACGRPAS